MANILPDTRVVRAFSHIDWDLLVPSAVNEPGKWAAGYAADDEDAAQTVESLIVDMGYVPVRVGRLAESASLDPGGVLWPSLLTPEAMRSKLERAGNSGE